MKSLLKYVVPLILLACAGTFGVVQYLHSKDRGRATEEAADAIADAANAAVDWTRDKTPHTVDVYAFFGEGRVGGRPAVIAVRAQVTAIGQRRMSELCAAMPTVRDAMNTLLFDRIHSLARAHAGLDPAMLADYAPALKAEINRAMVQPLVDRIEISLGNPAAATDEACKPDRNAQRH
jgi:hypothetical protein